VPITPDRTTATRAACDGISRYCSATCTAGPAFAHNSRRPARSAAGGVSDSTGRPRSTASATTRALTVRGSAVTTKSARTSSSDRRAGTGRSRGVRVTAPTQVSPSARAASRQNAAARYPVPTTANDVTARS
jgi:hypothetical protein